MVGLPNVTFGLPNASFSQRLTFSQKFFFLQNCYKCKRWPILHVEGPTWASRNFLHAAASEARPSNELGSKNWMFISNFSTWFFMASTLAVFNRTWSSKRCTLLVVWPISFLRIWSSMVLTFWILASSSCCPFYNISTNESWSGNSYSLCSASTWHWL